MKTEQSNTRTHDGWNYTRLVEKRSFFERLGNAARVLRHGRIELELFWKGDEVFLDAVSLRFGEPRLTLREKDIKPETGKFPMHEGGRS